MKKMSRVFYETWKVKLKNILRTNPKKLIISRIFQEPLTIQKQFKEFKELKNRSPPWIYLRTVSRGVHYILVYQIYFMIVETFF